MLDESFAAGAMTRNGSVRWAKARYAAAQVEAARNLTEHHAGYLSDLESRAPGRQGREESSFEC